MLPLPEETIATIERTLAALRKAKPHQFIMGSFIDNYMRGRLCETAGCIAGWVLLSDPNLVELPIGSWHMEQCAKAQLPGIECRELFYMHNSSYSMTDFDYLAPEVRHAAGIRVLEILQSTGEVKWEQAINEARIHHQNVSVHNPSSPGSEPTPTEPPSTDADAADEST